MHKQIIWAFKKMDAFLFKERAHLFIIYSFCTHTIKQ